jgi:hypothetical protein
MRSRNNSDGGGSGGGKSGKKHVEKKKEPTDGPAPSKRLNCGQKGHWVKDCLSKPKKGKAHVAQTEEEEEPSLFLASVGDFFPRYLFTRTGQRRAQHHTLCWLIR